LREGPVDEPALADRVRQRDTDRRLGVARAALEAGPRRHEHRQDKLVGIGVEVGDLHAAVGPLAACERLLADQHAQHGLAGL
jgi:hypothetical protein